MPTYTTSLGLTLPDDGETNWGITVNDGVTSLVDSAIAGYITAVITAGNAITLTSSDGSADQARNMLLNISGILTATGIVTIPARSKLYFIRNNTTGGFAITVTTGSGTTASIPNGKSMAIMCDGTNVREAVDNITSSIVTISTGAYTVLTTDYTIRVVGFATVTLPVAARFTGRILRFCTGAGGTTALTSASSNVVQQNTSIASTGIFGASATAKWCDLQSDGTYWYVTGGAFA